MNNLEDFKAVLEANNGVHVKERRASIGKDENGNKKYRMAFTYSFTDADGHKRSSRDFAYTKTGAKRGLGLSFTPDALSSAFKQRQSEQQAIDQEDAQIASEDVVGTNEDMSRRIELQQAINQLQDDSEEVEQNNGDQSEQPVWGEIEQIQFAQADTTGAEEQLNNQQDKLKRKLNEQRQRNQRQRQQRVKAEQTNVEQPKSDAGRTKTNSSKSGGTKESKSTTPTSSSTVEPSSSEPDDGLNF